MPFFSYISGLCVAFCRLSSVLRMINARFVERVMQESACRGHYRAALSINTVFIHTAASVLTGGTYWAMWRCWRGVG